MAECLPIANDLMMLAPPWCLILLSKDGRRAWIWEIPDRKLPATARHAPYFMPDERTTIPSLEMDSAQLFESLDFEGKILRRQELRERAAQARSMAETGF
ncbi:unnamed protein product, partial [Mesorhabditis spiculigera]